MLTLLLCYQMDPIQLQLQQRILLPALENQCEYGSYTITILCASVIELAKSTLFLPAPTRHTKKNAINLQKTTKIGLSRIFRLASCYQAIYIC